MGAASLLYPLISYVQGEASESAQRHRLNNLARKGRGSSKPKTTSRVSQRGIARRSRYRLCGTIFLLLFFSIANAIGGHEAGLKATLAGPIPTVRSEERRVGKECGGWWCREYLTENSHTVGLTSVVRSV